MSAPRLLDLFCGAGGAGMGYAQAGFDVVGVDIARQPRYPFVFIQADVLTLDPAFVSSFDAIHASPPCQAHTKAQRLRKNAHPDMIEPVREMLVRSGVPYVIENVEGAPLIAPVILCGEMFGLRTYRHRLFECSFFLLSPPHPPHDTPSTKMGRRLNEGEFMHVVGNFVGVDDARRAMGIPWMSRKELAQAIPPAFTQFIGGQMMLNSKRGSPHERRQGASSRALHHLRWQG